LTHDASAKLFLELLELTFLKWEQEVQGNGFGASHLFSPYREGSTSYEQTAVTFSTISTTI
jgi:hypothetical protein